ncbi:hypothetical protein [Parasulfuritortus cantonensis]|uniref:hypothetical protein n=1 Tax=Parasulfuritortus cantonensis TaxID=2528202 RepID=UPI001404487B|nr:hypothetical protein [Parasulfuritortus cantonensis]
MNKIKLDPTKLFGFKILGRTEAGDQQARIAAKVGGKPVIRLGSKIGSKVGSKPVVTLR